MSYSEVSSRDCIITSNKRVSYSEVKFEISRVWGVVSIQGEVTIQGAVSIQGIKYSICYGTVYSLIYYLL